MKKYYQVISFTKLAGEILYYDEEGRILGLKNVNILLKNGLILTPSTQIMVWYSRI